MTTNELYSKQHIREHVKQDESYLRFVINGLLKDGTIYMGKDLRWHIQSPDKQFLHMINPGESANFTQKETDALLELPREKDLQV